MAIPSIKFEDGYSIPMLGLGTAHPKLEEIVDAVKYAIDIGYRHIDTAYLYGNEKYIGQAIQDKINDGTVNREELFITTKLWQYSHGKNAVLSVCKESLKNLGLDYIDLYLIHWPFALKKGDDYKSLRDRGKMKYDDIDYLETWKGMEECKRLGLTRSIGVSNFNSEQISRIISLAEMKPVNNQIEVSLNLNQKPLIDFCNNNGITVTGYSPLGKPGNIMGIDNLWTEPVIEELTKKYKKTPAQIALRFIIQLGVVPIPKSIQKCRIKENFEVFDFQLTSDEMKAIKAIETGRRVMIVNEAKDFKYYPFSIPF